MMKTIIYRKFVAYLVFILFSSLACNLALSRTTRRTVSRTRTVTPKVSEVKYWTGPESTQIAFYFQGSVKYDVSDLPDKKGFEFYASNADCSEGSKVIKINDDVVDKINVNNSGKGCHITVTFMVPTDYKVSPKYPGRNYPVVEILRPMNLRPAHPTPEQIAELKKDHKIIMIDPGHGGWHYGAGGNGLLEKDVTMEMAIELKKKIDAIPGMIAFMTRDPKFNHGDYYVSLDRRRDMAAEYGADLFISLHLNSPSSRSKRSVHGTEVYFLAYGDASDEEAQELADLENAADLDPGEINKQNDPMSELLSDERMIALNNQSSLLAGLVLSKMMETNGLSNRGIKHARFAVLKNSIPAILVEVAFVTNPHEAKLLRSSSFQDDLMNNMSDAIIQYLAINKGKPADTQTAENNTISASAQ